MTAFAPLLITPKRGELWLVDFDPTSGSEIAKTRPGLVVSLDSMTKLPIRIVVPITAWKAHHQHLYTRVALPATRANGLTKDSQADVAQIRALSVTRFKHRMGVVTAGELADVAAAVAMAVGAA